MFETLFVAMLWSIGAPPCISLDELAVSATPITSCDADTNFDGVIDIDDLNRLLDDFGCVGRCKADVNCDLIVDQEDMTLVLAYLNDFCADAPCFEPWTSEPPQPIIGGTGVAFADFDQDGWPDAFAATGKPDQTRRFYWNVYDPFGPADALLWEEAIVADGLLPAPGYGASAGDYNNDGYPDVVIEPRNSPMAFLIKTPERLGAQTGQANFVLANELISCASPSDPDCPWFDYTETACWGDLDGDGLLDLLVPAYRQLPAQHGNFLFHNLGPAAAEEPWHWPMQQIAAEAGVENVLHTKGQFGLPRVEGAQLCDYDSDGDLDILLSGVHDNSLGFCDDPGGVVYQNITACGEAPRFRLLDLHQAGGWPGEPGFLDESLVMADFDMDGDFDMLLRLGLHRGLWLSRGDGTFAEAQVDASQIPPGHDGGSAADWDNDGDLDLVGSGGMAQNLRANIGEMQFQLVRLQDPAQPSASFLSSWADVDRDGDLDAAFSRFKSAETAAILRNHLLEPGTDPADVGAESDRRFVKVRPVRALVSPEASLSQAPDDDAIGGWADWRFTENEFGARVEVTPTNLGPLEGASRHVQFTSSSAGYLAQSEYVLHFGLPEDPNPQGDVDLLLDVSVDFPACGGDGAVRIDSSINPVLGAIPLRSLYMTDPLDPDDRGRVITVYRDGRVLLKGKQYFPTVLDAQAGRALHAIGGPAALPGDAGFPAPEQTAKGSAPALAALRFDKPDTAPLALREVVLDAVLAAGSESAPNVALVRVDPLTLEVLEVLHSTALHTEPHNRRSTLPLTPPIVLTDPGMYEFRALAVSWRAYPLAALSGPPGATVEVLPCAAGAGELLSTPLPAADALTGPVRLRASNAP